MFVDQRLSCFLPFVASNGILAMEPEAGLRFPLTRTEDALAFGGYVAVALMIGTVLFYRRDAN